MADFEGLIRQALKSQNASDPATRQRIYQSSRNALARMLEKAYDQPIEKLQAHARALEESITRIEAQYAGSLTGTTASSSPPSPVSSPMPSPVSPPPVSSSPPDTPKAEPVPAPMPKTVAPPVTPEPGPFQKSVRNTFHPDKKEPSFDAGRGGDETGLGKKTEPYIDDNNGSGKVQGANASMRTDSGQNAAVSTSLLETKKEPRLDIPETVQTDYADDPRPELRTYKRKNPILRRLAGLLMLLAVLLVILWLLYAFFTNLPVNQSETDASGQPVPQSSQLEKDENFDYITLLDPQDTSALITSGRGSAEIVNEQNTQMVRIQSIRQDDASGDLAEPVLLELQPGVLRQVSGKPVTVEIKAKSGSSAAATFAVECLVDGVSVCTRKRFQVGQQPLDIVFQMELDEDATQGGAFLAVNTDIRNSADTSGKGDVVDIVYSRIRMAK